MAATLLLATLILAPWHRSVPLIFWPTLIGFSVLIIFLILRGNAPAPAAAEPAGLLPLFCRELRRQHRLRTILVWWWFNPLFTGLVLNFLLVSKGEPSPLRPIVGVVLIILLWTCIHAFNRERASQVRRKIGDLQVRSA